MWKSLSPTLLILALSSAIPVAAADQVERDQSAAAVITFVEQRMRLPAKRWLNAWLEARHQDPGQWMEKALRYRFAERFADLTPNPTEAAALKKYYTDNRVEMEKAKGMPPAVKQLLYGSGGALDRIKKEIIAVMDPNLPPPQVKLVPEKKALLTRLIKSLADQATVEFAAALVAAKAHIAGPEKDRIQGKIPEGPKTQEIDNLSVSLRADALHILMTAHSVLRDVVMRAKEFDIQESATVADAWLEKTAKEHVSLFAAWDYDWGDQNPFLRFYCQVWMGEAVRQGVKTYKDGTVDMRLKFEDVETKLVDLIATDTIKIEREWRDEMIGARFRAMDQLLRWSVEMTRVQQDSKLPSLRKLNPRDKNDKYSQAELALDRELREGQNLSPKEVLERARKRWVEFRIMSEKDANLTLEGVPKSLQIDFGFMYLSLGRLHMARNDAGEAAKIFAELANAKKMHPGIRDYAKRWMTASASADGGGGGGSWGPPTPPMDPAGAVMVAQQLFAAANDTIDPKLQEESLIRAAVALKGGISGLDNRVYAGQVVAQLPQVYGAYVAVLVRLGLRQHAAIAGTEGMTRIVAILDQEEKAKRPNPWKTTNEGKDWARVKQLAKQTSLLAKNVYGFNKGFGPIAEAARNFQVRIDPDAAGPNNDIDEIFQLIQDRRYEEAIAKCKEFIGKYAAKYPKEELQVFAMLVNARLGLIDKPGVDAAKAAQVGKELAQDNAVMQERITKELQDAQTTPERKRDVERAKTTILSCDIFRLMRDKKYAEVLAFLGPEFWKTPPADAALSANMLIKLCQACGQRFNEVNKKPDKDVVLTAAAEFLQAYDTFERQAKRLDKANVDADLRKGARILNRVLYGTAQLAAQLKAQEPKFTAIESAALRGYANLFEPLIDDKTTPDEVWKVATVLWDTGAHERAKKQFERYQALLAKDEELQAFKQDAKAIIAGYATKINVRAEFKNGWDEVVDLSWDSQEDLKALMDGVENTKNQIANFGRALRKLSELMKGPVAKVKDVMKAEDHAAVVAAVKAFDRLLGAAYYDRRVTANLATAYREAGDLAKALPMLLDLYMRDPTDLEAKSGFVEGILLGVRDNKINPKTEEGKTSLTKAREIIAAVRTERERDSTNRDGYWLAYIQGQELTAALGEIAKVNDTLAFLRVNRSDVSRDLVLPAVELTRVDGTTLSDDPRCRRPRNVQAIQLAERFLKLFALNGISEKPAFRIGKILELEEPEVFIDAGAPDFARILVKDENDDETGLLLPVGTVIAAAGPARAPAPAPAPAPEPAPASAVPTDPAASPAGSTGTPK